MEQEVSLLDGANLHPNEHDASNFRLAAFHDKLCIKCFLCSKFAEINLLWKNEFV